MEPEGFETSYEERQAVARDECRMSGHSFVEVMAVESLAPWIVLCDRCGSSWRIHPDDAKRNFTEGDVDAPGEHYGS